MLTPHLFSLCLMKTAPTSKKVRIDTYNLRFKVIIPTRNLSVWFIWTFLASEVISSDCCLPPPADTDVKVAGNPAASGTNSSAQTGGSPSPSSSPPLSMSALGPQAIPRRHAPADVIARQGSFRGFPALSQKTSPFKRQLSLRMNELPSTMQRKSDFPIKNTGESGILTSCPGPPLIFSTA